MTATQTMTDTERGLMNRILENPGDDNARLVYADYLQEHCDQPNRAEFIRVQCELAGMTCPPECIGVDVFGDDVCTVVDCQWTIWNAKAEVLRQRERELWDHVYGKRGSIGGRIIDYCLEGSARATGEGLISNEEYITAIVSRGFPSRVRCSLDAWAGGECERCGGNGESMVTSVTLPSPSFVTQMSVTIVGLYDRRLSPCGACGGRFGEHGIIKGTGRTPGIGPQVCRNWPILAVEIVGREPYQWSRLGRFGWFVGDERVGILPIPDEARLPWEVLKPMGDPDSPSRQAALDALNAAALKWAQAKAKESGAANS